MNLRLPPSKRRLVVYIDSAILQFTAEGGVMALMIVLFLWPALQTLLIVLVFLHLSLYFHTVSSIEMQEDLQAELKRLNA